MRAREAKPTRPGTLEVSGKGPVRLRVTAVDSTTATLEIGVDYALAPVPGLHYDADYSDVVEGRTGVVLVFGKLRPGGKDLRTKIEIAFSAEYFVKQVWRSSRGFHETVRRLSAGKELAAVDSPQETERVQCFRSNNVFMAVLGEEAVLDFYYISPGDIHLAQKERRPDISLEPIVRVLVSTPVLLEFLEKCRPFAERWRAAFEEEEV